MGKPKHARSMPSTPRSPDDPADLDKSAPPVTPSAGDPVSAGGGAKGRGSGRNSGAGSEARADDEIEGDRPREPRPEPEYLMKGTGCVAGHAPGRERDAGPIGDLPTARTTWIGVSLLMWCGLGVYFLVDPRWMDLAILGLLLWLGFSALVQRRAGHRGKCLRTRAWRHAWGGLVPTRD